MSENQKLSLLIVGAGAIGSYFTVLLSLAGHKVTVLARSDRLETVQRDGVSITLYGEIRHAVVDAQEQPDGLPPQDCVIICTKTFDIGDALTQLYQSDIEVSSFLTVQNGVESPARVAQMFPSLTVMAGRVHGFFEMTEASVRHVGVAPSLTFGHYAGPPAEIGTRLNSVLCQAGIDCTLVPDIRVELWKKFLLASTVGGVAAAIGIGVGEIFSDKRASGLLLAALSEVETLAHAQGVNLPAQIVPDTLAFVETFPSHATTSLQRDLMHGVASEYQELTGAVLRMAREMELGTPTFDEIDIAIRAKYGTKL